LFSEARLNVEVDVIADSRPVLAVIDERPTSADLTLIGLPDPCTNPDDFPERLAGFLTADDSRTATAFVLASTDVDLDAILD
jgi:hypothetical protein